jgi:diguanylate cyclase (GGDEF)-like protein
MDLQKKLEELEKRYQEVESTNRSLSGRLSELFVLYNLARVLSTTFDLHQILTRILKLFRDSLSIRYVSLHIDPSYREMLQLESPYGTSKEGQQVVLLPKEEWLDHHSEPGPILRLVRDESDARILDGDVPVLFPLELAGFPLFISGKKVAGFLNFFREAENPFTQDEIRFFGQLAQELSNILDKVVLFVQTREDTYRDHLTGTYNRRYFNQRIEMEIKRAERYKRNLSLLMIDIDNFKDLNDEYGHITGDEVLKNLVAIAQKNLRSSDVLCRYGGEEFVALLPETNARNAFIAAEKLRIAIEQNLAIVEAGIKRPVTVSIGVSNFPNDAYSAKSLVEAADRRLYLAKKAGKNRTVGSENERDFEPLESDLSS